MINNRNIKKNKIEYISGLIWNKLIKKKLEKVRVNKSRIIKIFSHLNLFNIKYKKNTYKKYLNLCNVKSIFILQTNYKQKR